MIKTLVVLVFSLAASMQASTTTLVNDQSDGAGHWKGSEQIYEKSCAACHSTGIGPVIKGLPLPAPAFAHFVRHGVETMPAFKESEINDQELQALGSWLATAKGGNKP